MSARLTRENYCHFCVHRAKLQQHTVCLLVKQPVARAMRDCSLLKPWEAKQGVVRTP